MLGSYSPSSRRRAEIQTRPIMNARFAIPPGDPNYRVESTYTFTRGLAHHSLMPHMHLRGKDFEYRVDLSPTAPRKCCLSVPKYDFEWQTYYVLKEPLACAEGHAHRLPRSLRQFGRRTSTTPIRRKKCAGAIRPGKR